MKKRWVRAAIAVAALVILVLVSIPFFINADTFRATIENQLSSALGRKVSLGHLSASLLSGGLVADNISIADDPAFSATPFLQAKKLSIGAELVPLLFHRQVRVTSFVVDSHRFSSSRPKAAHGTSPASAALLRPRHLSSRALFPT